MDVLSAISESINGSVAALARRKAPWGVRFECDFTAGFHVLLRGSAVVLSKGGSRMEELDPGDIAFFARGEYHELRSDAEAPAVPVTGFRMQENDGDSDADFISGRYLFPSGPMHPLFRALPDQFIITHRSLGFQDPIHTMVQLIAAEFNRPDSSRIVLGRLTDTLFHYILRHWMTNTDAPGRWKDLYSDEVVLRAVESMEQKWQQPWNLEKLGTTVGLSRATLSRRFKEATGVAPMEYLLRIRMQRAARMLQEGHRKVEEISREVGYESSFAFSRSFKRLYGKSPAHFRSHIRAEAERATGTATTSG
jgi:AraC-like DNA-binding protein